MAQSARAIAAALALCSAIPARAVPTFSALQYDIVCPEFDVDKKPDKDDEPLYSLSRRVYHGTILGEKKGCDQIKHGQEGWYLARVTWSSDNNPDLYQEITAIWAGEDPDESGHITLFLDGNGNPADFRRVYEDRATNIMNEPGLTVTVEVANPDFRAELPDPNEKPDHDDFPYLLVNQQKVKPTPWAIWSLHSTDTDFLLQLINAQQSQIQQIEQQEQQEQQGQNGRRPVYVRSHPSCGGEQHDLTNVATCTYTPGCNAINPPSCESGCAFNETQTIPQCKKTCVTCDWTCTTYCCEQELVICGNCVCQNQLYGYVSPP